MGVTTANKIPANAVEAYVTQLDRLITKFDGWEDERAQEARGYLTLARDTLVNGATPVEAPDVEQPKDDEGNPLPAPSPMELPQR